MPFGPHRLALVLALLTAAPAAAADMTERRIAALVLLEREADDAMIHRLTAGPVRQLLQATEAVRRDLTAQDMLVLSALYHDEMYHAALAALRARAEELAGRYSLRELQALRTFGATEEGRAVLREDPGLTGGLEQLIEAAMLARMDDALERHGTPD